MTDRLAIARMLREIGRLLEVQGNNTYRARAYERGAGVLEAFGGDLSELVRAKRLEELPGVGSALATVIAEAHDTGRSELLDRLRGELPPGVLELIELPGLSLARIGVLDRELGIASVAALREAAEAGRLRELAGFGPATERKILEGIAALGRRENRMRLDVALAEGRALLGHMRGSPAVAKAALVGSLRRRADTIGSLDVLAATSRPEIVREHFASWPLIERLAEDGDPATGAPGPDASIDARIDARLARGTRATLFVTTPERWGAALVRTTGSPAHVAHLERLAAEMTVRLGPARTERRIYRRLGLPRLPPELREDQGEIEAAAAGDEFADLIRQEHLCGMTHCHTTYSDGKASVLEMARAAEAMGMAYITITDHSPTATYARGLELDRLKRQWDEIAAAQGQVGIRILRGTESDILRDGSLDYPDSVLEQLDVVIASIHNRYGMGEDDMTRRLVRAMRLPLFKVWGHGLGRKVLERPPIACRVEEVLDAIAASRAAIEINGDPHRLDLEPVWVREARKRGIRFVLSTDAHATWEMENLPYAVAMARRGWVRRGEVLNALPADDFVRAVTPAGSA